MLEFLLRTDVIVTIFLFVAGSVLVVNIFTSILSVLIRLYMLAKAIR